jgi:RHS repeat-associated protein
VLDSSEKELSLSAGRFDMLAQTTGPQWGESFTYDGFGNLTSEVATKGTAFTGYQTYNATTNRLTGGGTSYDANGNLLTMAGGLTMTYDEENRMVQAVNSSSTTETDIYNPSGQLVYRQHGTASAELYMYGPQGQRIRFGLVLPSWSDNNQLLLTYTDQELSFAGKLLEADDRIGTSVVTPGPTGRDGRTYPYGELRSAPASGGNRYATYLLDTTTNLNYAQHRWYSSQVARFTTADPSGLRYPYAGADPQLPQSWNRYGYAEGDPINFNDPSGLNTVTLPPVVPGLNCSTSFIDYAAQFGESIQQLFDSDQGILGVMSFFEQEGSGSGADAQVWAALDWTFINQYRLSPSDKAWFYGPHNIPGSFAATVTTGPARSQVFTNGGQLTSGFTAQLLNILTGSPGSDDCAGLAVAFDTASGVIEAANGAGAVLVSPIPDPYPNALQFGSNGYVPGHGGYVVQSPAGQIPDGDNVWTFFSDVYNPPRPTVRRPPPIRVPRPRHQVGVPQ